MSDNLTDVRCEVCNQRMTYLAEWVHNGFVERRFYRCPGCESRLTVPPMNTTPRELDPLEVYLTQDLRAGYRE